LPPYSPDYNPIEEAFSWVKAVIRRNGEAFREAVDQKDNLMVLYYLHSVLAKITPDLAIGWMGNSGYISVVY
jgi:transposase